MSSANAATYNSFSSSTLALSNANYTLTGGTVSAGLWGGTTGTGAARYTSFTNGRSPIWNQLGHERMGWAISVYNPAAP